MLNDGSYCDVIILGKLTRETIVNQRKELFLDQPGGNLLYTAYGFALWGKKAGLVSRVGCDFPDEWIEDISINSLSTLGISKAPCNSDSRSYFLVDSNNKAIEGNPRKYFADQYLPMPKVLLGYEPNPIIIDSRKQGTDYSVRPENFPDCYLDSRYLALCPVDFLTHNMIPAFFRTQTGGEVFIHASSGYTHSSFFYDFPSIVNGTSVLLISEDNAKKLFLGKLEDTWLIAETLASYGIEIIIISKKNGGYDTLDNFNMKKYHIPSYPVNCIDPIGVDDAFFGGFLAGYLTNFDPLYASIIGSVTASVKNEGSTPRFLLGILKDLLKARVDYLKDNIELV